MIAFGILVSKDMPDTDGNQYVTRADLRAELLAVEDRMIKTIAKAIAQSQAEILEKTQEFVRDSQTELLRGFDAFSTAFHRPPSEVAGRCFQYRRGSRSASHAHRAQGV